MRRARLQQGGAGGPRQDLQLNTREGLNAGVRLAYRSYRRQYQAPVATAFRRLRDLLVHPVPEPQAFRAQYGLAGSNRVRFIGVWDTVDAVGLPVDELSTMIDRIFYPHRFPDQKLSPQVDRACHAIAIDDERHTFHPVLWNEEGSDNPERIKQVWFAGMHSNVGGGYPDDDLAFVPLRWMIGEAQYDPDRGDGLRFDQDSLRDIGHRVQPLGRMHNSRRGLGVYYRYNPRHVATLCDDRDNDVRIALPKIHQAVFTRIAENTAGYAPAGLPTAYRVVDDDGAVSDPNPTSYESADQRRERARLLERAQHHVFWRRVLYYLFVLVTVALCLLPYYRPAIPGAEPDGWLETGSVGCSAGCRRCCRASSAPRPAGGPKPGPSRRSGSCGLAAIYGFLLWHSRLDRRQHPPPERDRAGGTSSAARKPKPPTPPVGLFERLAAACATSAG